jgi:bacterioferritin (cytochrome b1)
LEEIKALDEESAEILNSILELIWKIGRERN